MSESIPARDHSSLPTFSANPYRADGGCSMTGLVTLSMAASLAAIVIGLLAGFVSQWFYLVNLFPILMGGAIGVAGSFGVKKGKVRMPLVCGGTGFLAGCLSVLAMHYYEYHSFENALQKVPDGVRMVAKNFDKFQASRDELPPEIKQLVEEIGKDQETRQALAISTFTEHLDFKAKQGVTISKRGKNGINLGYTGSYIYWGIELLVIAGIAFLIMNVTADEPFCSECENWKVSEPLGSFGAIAADAKQMLVSGNLPELSANIQATGDLVASLFQCPNCKANAPVEVQFEQVSVNAKGETSKSTICTVTYPGEAVPVLSELFQPQIVAASVPNPDTPPTA